MFAVYLFYNHQIITTRRNSLHYYEFPSVHDWDDIEHYRSLMQNVVAIFEYRRLTSICCPSTWCLRLSCLKSVRKSVVNTAAHKARPRNPKSLASWLTWATFCIAVIETIGYKTEHDKNNWSLSDVCPRSDGKSGAHCHLGLGPKSVIVPAQRKLFSRQEPQWWISECVTHTTNVGVFAWCVIMAQFQTKICAFYLATAVALLRRWKKILITQIFLQWNKLSSHSTHLEVFRLASDACLRLNDSSWFS